MPFSVTTLTSKGTELLAAATVSDRLIIVGCDADTTQLNQTQAQAIQTRPVSPTCTTTEVTSLSVASDHITCRIYFNSTDSTGGDVKSLYLYGYLESAPSDIYVIYVVSNSTTFHLPTSSDVINEWEGKLDIVYTISPDSVGFATLATYASESEFSALKNDYDSLKDRVVTTHAAGTPTQGDPNQNIYGLKTFNSSVSFNGSVDFTNSVSFDFTPSIDTHIMLFTYGGGHDVWLRSDKKTLGSDYYTECAFTFYDGTPTPNELDTIAVYGNFLCTREVILGNRAIGPSLYYADMSGSASLHIEFMNTETSSPQFVMVEAPQSDPSEDYIAITSYTLEINSTDVYFNASDITFTQGSGANHIEWLIPEEDPIKVWADDTDTGSLFTDASNVRFRHFVIDVQEDYDDETTTYITIRDRTKAPTIVMASYDDPTERDYLTLEATDLFVRATLSSIRGDVRLVNPDNDHYVAVKCSEDAFMVYNDIVTAYTQSSSRTNLGRNTRPFNEVWAVAFQLASTYANVCIFEDDGDIVLQPASGGAVSINYMNCNGMYGLAPHLNSSTLSLAIGGLIDVWSSELVSIQSVIHAGEQITIPANTVYTVQLDGATGKYVKDSSYTIPAGKYRALIGMDMTTSTYHNFITLQRES